MADTYSTEWCEHASTSEEFFPSPSNGRTAKKVNRDRVKSAYRDAQFRPWFQALDALDALHAAGETSVTYVTPSHPLTPVLHLDASTHTLSASPSASRPLTDEEELKAARFWRTFYSETARRHRLPATWRELSDEARLEWFHNGLWSLGPVSAFTVRLDPSVEAQCRAAPNSAGWLSKRIARRLKAAFGKPVEFWFTFELSDRDGLHLHGEIGLGEGDLPIARKAIRLACGEWAEARQHQAHTRPDPSAVWTGYAAKDAFWTRPLAGRLATLPRPINGDWIFATNKIRSVSADIYSSRRRQAISLMKIYVS